MNKIKDIFYESADYILILAIIVVIGIVIGWRLNILFKPDETINTIVAESESLDKTPDISYEPAEPSIPSDTDTVIDTPVLSDEPIKIIIVEDSTWTDVAEQLSARSLISDKDKFISTVNDLNLQDNLKCRTFYLNYQDSYERYALILAGDLSDSAPADVKGRIVELKVSNGSSWDKVAADLLELEIISSKRDFLSTVTKLKLESKLQPGSYELKADSTLETIVKILCKKN